jgi:sulfide:quinone oxidoreductase
MKIVRITPHFAVTGSMRPEDFAAAAALGFKSVVSNRPDGETSAYPSSREEAELAAQAGIGFRHIPATKFDVLSDRVVEDTADALTTLPGPVLAHCASGLRSAMAWAAAAARSQPADCVLRALKGAGFDLEPIREDLEGQRGRKQPERIAPALDAGCEKDVT